MPNAKLIFYQKTKLSMFFIGLESYMFAFLFYEYCYCCCCITIYRYYRRQRDDDDTPYVLHDLYFLE